MRAAVLALLLTVLPTGVFGQPGQFDLADMYTEPERMDARFFYQLLGEHGNSINEILVKLKTGEGDAVLENEAGGWVSVVEITIQHTTVTGDTLQMWVQHDTPELNSLSEEARKADIIFSCFPRSITDGDLRRRHVFPNDTGYVWSYNMGSRYVVVTDRESKALAFATYHPIRTQFQLADMDTE